MSENNNPNTLGFTMIMGIFASIAKEKRSRKKFFLVVITVIIHLFIIVLSGSKKSIICGLFLVGIWFINYTP